jgi:hypothetical protein
MARREDLDHLKLLAIFHYVLAGLTALGASIPVIHLVIGLAIVSGNLGGSGPGQKPPPAMGWIFIVVGSTVIILGWGFAIALAVAGRFLQLRRHRLYCVVVAAISCASAPLGTILGVFTLIVLMRPGVKRLFERPPDWREEEWADDEAWDEPARH